MQITSLSLRNYRVFRTLDLEMPPGLVGIYGANGSGKSTLLESILWALYGKARTGKGEIASSGATGECLVELGFEHEDHHYLVRRSISGLNATVKTRVMVGSDVVADGINDVARYLRSTLGMDERAFRSSVFAEQKQLAAFSDQTPDQRRRLVLQLLGITPVEKARDQARADFRTRQTEHGRLQTLLGPIDDKTARLASAQAELVEIDTQLERARSAAAQATAELEAAERAVTDQAEAHTQDQHIRQLGGAARKRRDEAQDMVGRLVAELAELDEVQDTLDGLSHGVAVELADAESRLEAVVAWRDAQRRLEALGPHVPVPDAPDDRDLHAVRQRRTDLAAELGSHDGQIRAAKALVAASRAAVERSKLLDDEGECPVCGQTLRDGAVGVQQHRRSELASAEAGLAVLVADASAAKARLDDVSAALTTAERTFRESVEAHQSALQGAARHRDALEAVEATRARLGPGVDLADEARLRSAITGERERQASMARLRDRLTRRDGVERQLADQREKLANAEAERATLRARLDALGFDADAYRRTEERRVDAGRRRAEADRGALDRERAAAATRQKVADAEEALREAAERDRRLQELADEARYLGRTADLLTGFRQAVVGLIGPQLSVQASELFNDLTNNDYDGLTVDPETYEIKILDGGTPYPSERFSGSEVDLANLALRVAISEQVRFQAGGQVGLLVLDEALASLDTDRKDRMLAALTRLSGRFRQILVVTHAPEVKERLPQAIEVRSLGGRRSTAQVIESSAFGST